MATQVINPFHVFFDRAGMPLDAGYIYIGAENQNAQAVPIQVYWDEALTIPAAQPIRTVSGYPSRAGTPAVVYLGSDDFSITVRDNGGALVFSALSATTIPGLAEDLANDTDPDKGATMVARATRHFKSVRTWPADSGELQERAGRYDGDIAYVAGYWDDMPGVGAGEFRWDAASTETPDDALIVQVTGVATGRWKRVYDTGVMVTWYGARGNGSDLDTVAIQAAHANPLNRIVGYRSGTYLINAPIEVANNGQKIMGVGGQRFSANRTTVQQTVAGTVAYQQQASTASGQEDAFSMCDMDIYSDRGILLNPQTGLVVDGGGALFPYLMRPEFRRLTLRPLTAGLAGSYGIFMAKTFDHIIEQCDFNSHARCLVMNGCDLGRISTNRLTNFHEYAILELSAGTFGSQNLITNNDIVNAAQTTATFYRSTARHVRFVDNYLEEASGTCKGFVDLTWESGLDYGANTSSGMYGTVEVHSNRLDGHTLATDFIYRFDPTVKPTFGYGIRIEDPGTNSAAPTLPWMQITGSTLPLRVGASAYKQYRLRGGYYTSNVQRFTAFQTSHLLFGNGQVVITAENLVNMNRSELNRNNAADHVGLSDGGFVIKTTLGTALFHVVLPTVGGVNNPYLRNGASIPVKIKARCVSGTQNLNVLKVVDALPQGSTISTSLDTQFQTISFNFTGVASSSTVGLALSFGATQSADIVIQSITFG